jgi:hypothetical protein
LAVANTGEKIEKTTQMLGKNWRWTVQLSGTENPDIKQVTVTIYLENEAKQTTQLIGYYSPPKSENYNAN